jgi:hypothetical protein
LIKAQRSDEAQTNGIKGRSGGGFDLLDRLRA